MISGKRSMAQKLKRKQGGKKMNHIIDRFKEPSSYAALAGVLAMIGVTIPVDLWQNIIMIACGASGVVGFFMSEKVTKKK